MVDPVRLAAQVVGVLLAFALALFLGAGTPGWAGAWVFLALFGGFVVALSLWLLRNDPSLLAERLSGVGREDQKSWDKVLLALTAVLFFAWLVLMGLDVARFRRSQMPVWLQVVGALAELASFGLFFLTFRENTFLSPAVRIQTERGHAVVSSGPYRYVRHPMYAGFVLFVLGTSLLLGSWLGLLACPLLVAAVARRAVLEERALRAELDGYDAYVARVRYRLVPHIW